MSEEPKVSTSANHRDAQGRGQLGEGFALALIYAIALVTTYGLQGSSIDGWKLVVPAVGFAGAGGWLLQRFPQHRPVLLCLVASAVAAGIVLGLS